MWRAFNCLELEIQVTVSLLVCVLGTEIYSSERAIAALFLKIFIFILCLRVFYLHVCLCTISMPGALGDQKRVSGFLQLVLKMILSHHVVGARVRTLLSHLSSPQPRFLIAHSIIVCLVC